MMPTSSLQRRLFFAADTTFALQSSRCVLARSNTALRAAELCSQLIFDAIESARARRVVPSFGRPTIHVPEAGQKVAQHPRYRTYYQDSARNAVVGMHLGVDFIFSNGKLFPVDINLNAALRPERRRVYRASFDPFLQSLREVALRTGRRKVVCYAETWGSEYLAEFSGLSELGGVQFEGVSRVSNPPEHTSATPSLCPELEEDCLYVVFHYQHSALDHFVTNQRCTSRWLAELIAAGGTATSSLGTVDAFGSLKDAAINTSSTLPNVVIKLGGGWSGDLVRMLRLDEGLLNTYKQKTDSELRSLFRLSAARRLKGWIGRHHELVFQRFVPPSTDEAGRAWIIRAHMLVAPGLTTLLSCHGVVSDTPLPKTVPIGVVTNDSAFVVNFSRGAHYGNCSTDETVKVALACEQLGSVVHLAISNHFLWEAS
jgi:hypothetical protein